jgi:ABC-type phosphate transport system permease subunit
MSPRIRKELGILLYFFILFFVGSVLLGLFAEFIAAPFLRWVFHDEAYTLPTLDRLYRWIKLVAFITVWCGLIMWYHEKRSSGR